MTGPLSRRSFELHARLAQELGHDTGYRRVQTPSVAASAGARSGAAWLSASREYSLFQLRASNVESLCAPVAVLAAVQIAVPQGIAPCNCLSPLPGPPKSVKVGKSSIPSWLDTGRVTRARVMADEDTTAQVLNAWMVTKQACCSSSFQFIICSSGVRICQRLHLVGAGAPGEVHAGAGCQRREQGRNCAHWHRARPADGARC